MTRTFFLLGLLAGLGACSILPDQPPEPPPALNCSAGVYRQFDFWIGNWQVIQPDQEAPRAYNRIQPILRGCALFESYRSASGFAGESISWYDPAWGQWRQTWSDRQGLVLRLAGGLDEAGRMVLYGQERDTAKGETVRDRITWQPLADGVVSQLWEVSNDEGLSWRKVFLGHYHPEKDMPFRDDRQPGKPSLLKK